jgi:hypothetical protein
MKSYEEELRDMIMELYHFIKDELDPDPAALEDYFASDEHRALAREIWENA